MLKRLLGETPAWTKRDNPLLRYELVRHAPDETPRTRILRVAGWVMVLSLLLIGGYLLATNGATEPLQLPYTMEIWTMLFFPLLLLQLVARIAGLSLGVASISDARRRQTWDNLRSTERGAAIGLRTRWFAILMRLRGLLATILLGRVVLIAALLYELTSFQGDYLNLLIARSVPSLPLGVGVMILATTLTALLLLPITATGVDVALGLLISTALPKRAFAGLTQVLFVVFGLVSTALLGWLTWGIVFGDSALAFPLSWLTLGGFAWVGDWGLLLAQLTVIGQVWVDVPYSVFLGLSLLLAVLLQIALIGVLLTFAIRIAEQRG